MCNDGSTELKNVISPNKPIIVKNPKTFLTVISLVESIPWLLKYLQIRAQVVPDCAEQFFDYMAVQLMFHHVHLVLR